MPRIQAVLGRLSVCLALLLPACSGPMAPAGVGSVSSGNDDGDGPGSTAQSESPAPAHFAIVGAEVLGVGPADVVVRDGVIEHIGRADVALPTVDATGRFVVPAFIDSHVHLAYFSSPRALAAGGVAAAVDLAAPMAFFEEDHAPLRVVVAGPMLTALGGYPTQSWGAGGYGLQVEGVDAVRSAVDALADAGAGVIKVAVTPAPALDDDELGATVERAHARGLKVVAHALGDAEAERAANGGVDMLAHTPVEPLRDTTVAAWSDGIVISTLSAFGGTQDAIDNLRRLREAGATVLYGTDLGNTSVPGIDPDEIALLVAAGLDGVAILKAATAAPATAWSMSVGHLEPGRPASLIVVDEDPRVEPLTLADPVAVYIDGALQPEPVTPIPEIGP